MVTAKGSQEGRRRGNKNCRPILQGNPPMIRFSCVLLAAPCYSWLLVRQLLIALVSSQQLSLLQAPPLAPRSTSRGHDLLNNSTSVACMRNTTQQGYYIAKSEIKCKIPSAHFALVRSYNGLTHSSRGWLCSNMRMSGGMLQSQVGARGQENGAHTPPQELFSKYLFLAAHKGKQDKRIIY